MYASAGRKVRSNILIRLGSVIFLLLFLVGNSIPHTALAQAGPLSGKIIVVNPGHGWYNVNDNNWAFQRGEYWGIGRCDRSRDAGSNTEATGKDS